MKQSRVDQERKHTQIFRRPRRLRRCDSSQLLQISSPSPFITIDTKKIVHLLLRRRDCILAIYILERRADFIQPSRITRHPFMQTQGSPNVGQALSLCVIAHSPITLEATIRFVHKIDPPSPRTEVPRYRLRRKSPRSLVVKYRKIALYLYLFVVAGSRFVRSAMVGILCVAQKWFSAAWAADVSLRASWSHMDPPAGNVRE